MRPTVLVVEDDAATRTLLTVVLTRAGFDVDPVANGSDALLLLSSVQYSAITLDLYMHGTSGHDVLASLARSMPDVLERVILVTAAPPGEVEQLRRAYRSIRAVRKPFDLNELIAKIGEAAPGPPPQRDFTTEFCRRSVLVGAHAGIAVTAPVARKQLDLAASFGYGSGTLEKFLPIDVDAGYPICKSYRFGRKIWLSSLKSDAPDYPLLSSIWEVANAQALVTMPLTSNERTIGAVGWAFREPRAFDNLERVELTAIARFVSEALAGTNAQKEAS